MKYLIYLFLLISTISYSQSPILKLSTDSVKTNTVNSLLNKGDEFYVDVLLNGNDNISSRGIYFDFEYQNTAFDIISIQHTGTIANGGVLPNNSYINVDWYNYPGYSWLATQSNTTTNGNVNYTYANYSYQNGGPKSIIRCYLTWSSPDGFSLKTFAPILRLVFRLKQSATGTSWSSIKMNFAASYNQNGSAGSTIMQPALSTNIIINPNAYKLIHVNIPLINDVNSDDFKFIIQPPIGIPHVFDITPAGDVNIVDSLLSQTTSYTSYLALKSDKIVSLYNSAITISDYMMTSREFSNQDLVSTGTTGLYIPTTAGRLFSDVNGNMKLDGGDVTKLFAQATGIDLPYTYTPQVSINSVSYTAIPTFNSTLYDNISGVNPFDIGTMKFNFTTGRYGSITHYNLKYGFIGDVDLSYSSKQNSQIVARISNVRIGSPSSSDVSINLKNYTVKTNTIEIPIDINTQTNLVNGLQFEFRYDVNKLKFEEIKTQLPDNWIVFVNNKNGIIKFGAINRGVDTNNITGINKPFTIKFSAISDPLNMNTYIRLGSSIDVISNNIKKLNVVLNSDVIKLTGYNNF
jgi:hypothetical protein